MRIGLISDTHLPSEGRTLPPGVARALRGVDLILHAGDIYVRSVLDELEEIAPVLAVSGGGVDSAIGEPRVVKQRVMQLGGLNIGLIHMLVITGVHAEVLPGVLQTHFPAGASLQGILTKNFGSPLDVVVFGDTHISLVEHHDGVLLVNPGSPTLPHNLRKLGTVGILELSGGKAEAHIIQLS